MDSLFGVGQAQGGIVARILVIDDDRAMCRFLSDLGKRLGHEISSVLTCREALVETQSKPFEVVFLDINLPDGDGLDLLPHIRDMPSNPDVIIISGEGEPDGAETALRNGAWDYIQKPSSIDAIKLSLARVLAFRERREAQRLSVEHDKGVKSLKRGGIIGESPKMRACLDLLAQAASSRANVIIFGETGTGKELFAWAIHENSPRAGNPFVVLDCAALTETLVESMLFGHERGAFTGANIRQDGMIRQAHGGTLLLDEIGELPLNVQKSFLRVLQERRFRPLGGKEEISSDFRLIAATNRDLEQMVQEKQFRKDLFFRLRSLTIELPPLRQRLEDIKDLAIHLTARHCELYGVDTKGLSTEFLNALLRYDWPGNVRELVHTMESSLIASGSEPVLYPDHLPIHLRIHLTRKSLVQPSANGDDSRMREDLPTELPTLHDFREAALTRVEKDYLQQLLALAGGDMKRTCEMAGLSRSQLYSLLKKHGMSRNG